MKMYFTLFKKVTPVNIYKKVYIKNPATMNHETMKTLLFILALCWQHSYINKHTCKYKEQYWGHQNGGHVHTVWHKSRELLSLQAWKQRSETHIDRIKIINEECGQKPTWFENRFLNTAEMFRDRKEWGVILQFLSGLLQDAQCRDEVSVHITCRNFHV